MRYRPGYAERRGVRKPERFAIDATRRRACRPLQTPREKKLREEAFEVVVHADDQDRTGHERCEPRKERVHDTGIRKFARIPG